MEQPLFIVCELRARARARARKRERTRGWHNVDPRLGG